MGASGDMIVGALLAAGGARELLAPIEDELAVTFSVESEVVCGIDATNVTILRDGDPIEGHGPHRSFADVTAIVEELPLTDGATTMALNAFRLLAEAEATVHGADVDAIHFHEVGADDAIADVTAAATLLDDLRSDQVVTGPLSVGDGTVKTSHGIYPIPPPAVAEIAATTSLQMVHGPVSGELLTPTGAAILGSVANACKRLPAMQPDTIGYGAGDRDFGNRPNVLRVMIGATTPNLSQAEIALLETHIDDTTPEVLGHLHDRLQEAGALDIAIVPTTMKKSRPGHLIKVVVDPADEQQVARALAEETGTLGVRSGSATHRWMAERRIVTADVTIDTESFALPVKIATDTDDRVIDISAEFDDAAAVATATNRPVRWVMEQAESAIRQTIE